MTSTSLEPFFYPRGVAVIGASQDPSKLGYGLARNLVQCNYQGAVHFVNPKGGQLLNRPVYTNIADVPNPVDLAVLLIPAMAVPQALRECGERGLCAVIIASGGFRETGSEGTALEAECLNIARTYGMRLLGPNCIGLLDTHLPLDVTFLPPPAPVPGEIAFISHSGAICAAVIDWAHGQGFGFSRLVSLGNQADINETDVLAPVAADPHTRVITFYMEGVSHGRRFVDEASRVVRQKPIIVQKVGRFAGGQRAMASHTGALAGQESAYEAAFHRAGMIRAETTEELFDWARALAWCPLPRGRSVAVLTNAGGPGVTAADALEANGLHLSDLRHESCIALKSILPPVASIHNPVDILASASPELYAACLKILLADSGVDAVMVIMPPPPMYAASAIAKAIIPLIQSADKPVLVCPMGERLVHEAVELFQAAHIPDYRFPERAAASLGIMAQRVEYLQKVVKDGILSNKQLDIDPESIRKILSEAEKEALKVGDTFKFWLPPKTVNQILAVYAIPTLPVELAHNPEEAVSLADRLGYPVALKVVSPDIPHKSDVGGVLLNLEDAKVVALGYETVMQNTLSACPQAEILGVQVQRMIPPGQEVILGAVQDPQFGALVMFGSGGVEVEGLNDVAFALAPLQPSDAEELLERTWAGRKLHGYRSLPPADRNAVLDILMRLAKLATDFPQLIEIEINPLRVLSEGQGAFALDVRVRIG
jgi:acetyltransferase